MNNAITNYASLDDVVFENRNITYGAYDLRQKYEKNLFMGAAITFGLFIIVVGIPKILEQFKVVEIPEERIVCNYKMIQLPPIVPDVILPNIKLPSPPPPPSTSNFIPNVTDQTVDEVDYLINDQPPPPTQFSVNDGVSVGSDVPDGDFGPVQPEEQPVEKPFLVVEQMPTFNGNIAAFLSQNLKYPDRAIRDNIEGKVYLSFVVASDGNISDIKILRGISKELDEEAIRVVKKMPAWNPGKQSGRAVPVQYALPIYFRLSDK